jgi:hypothetical protein
VQLDRYRCEEQRRDLMRKIGDHKGQLPACIEIFRNVVDLIVMQRNCIFIAIVSELEVRISRGSSKFEAMLILS